MIIKFFETKKINIENTKKILLYGKNEGLKSEVIEEFVKEKKKYL